MLYWIQGIVFEFIDVSVDHRRSHNVVDINIQGYLFRVLKTGFGVLFDPT
jgi:hypothetical protein